MKELSQIKPGLTGEAAKQAVFETSLTHIKYKYQGDESSTNLVAFNALADYAINKNGGVFTGPIQVKTTTADIVNVTAVNGVLTINLGFGKFFRVNLLTHVYCIEIINAPPDAATTFTLILTQESFSEQYYIAFVPNNDKVIKWYPNDHVFDGAFVQLAPYPGHRDIVTLSTLDGTTFFLSLTGLNYSGGGNSSYGTFIRSETNYITIDEVQYANGTVDIVSDGNGGETTGSYHYPPNYPETGYVEFKSVALPEVRAGDILPAQIFQDLGNSNFNEDSMISMGGTTTFSDGQGGYREVVGYYGSEASFGQKDIYVDVNGVSTFMGFRRYVGDGLGGATIVYSYEYENGDILAGPIDNTNLVFADDGQWYSIGYFYFNDGWPHGNVAFGGTFTIKANGFETVTENSYPEEGTVLASYPRYLGSHFEYNRALSDNTHYQKQIVAPANLVADGTGKVRSEVTIAPGSFLPIGDFWSWNNNDYAQFPPDLHLDWTTYGEVGCSSCAPAGMPAPPCYYSDFEQPSPFYEGCDINSYTARAIYDPTKWTASSEPPVGQGYFRIEIMPRFKSNGTYFLYYDFIENPDNVPWAEFSS